MKSWIFTFVGLSCLVGSLTMTAHGQQGTVPPPVVAGQQSSGKEIKFKLEWITTTVKPVNAAGAAAPPEIETVSLVTMDGETAMTANKATGTNTYRRVTLHPESQKDGSVVVDVSVSEFTNESERDTPRLSTRIRLKGADTKVLQARTSKGQGYEYEYLINISME